VIWPSETETDAQSNIATHAVVKPPDGVTHHYVALAKVTPDDQPAGSADLPLWPGLKNPTLPKGSTRLC
jgi:hypothetical protein